jgi:hypothetical protein
VVVALRDRVRGVEGGRAASGDDDEG